MKAKQKWCPFVQVIIGPDNATWQGQMLTNRGDIPADNTHVLCIGSGCMAWRWRAYPDEVKPEWGDFERGNGYCGLSEPA